MSAGNFNFPGMATHYKPAGQAAACGRPWVAFSTDDAAKVDCRQCRRVLLKITKQRAADALEPQAQPEPRA